MQEPLPTGSGTNALAALEERFWAMHHASRRAPPPDAVERKRRLRALAHSLGAAREDFVAVIAEDFGWRAREETLLAEILTSLTLIGDAARRVGAWMRCERRRTGAIFFGARSQILWQPKGVALIIAPWNYPLNLTVGPLAAALAAGNRVIVKPSEATPRTAALIAHVLAKGLPPDVVAVAQGGAEVAEFLARLPFDHILYTGSATVGQKVLQAAAQNLTPVTLELGGKSPAIVHESADLRVAVERIVRGKLLNAGQTCIAPDYALVPRVKLEDFLAHFTSAAARLYPGLLANRDYTAIVDVRHYERLLGMVEDAVRGGARLTIADPAGELAPGAVGSLDLCKIAPVALTAVDDAMAIMREEIFGPLLPVVPYATLEEAIAYVNSRPRPLALYYFDRDARRIADVLDRTVSGGATVNDTIYHFAQEALPFGGIGASGMGAYHGREGFITFSHAKAVLLQSRFTLTRLLNPPYRARFRRLLALALWRNGVRGT
jgi:coniferyl-aldehyde dehydrogenase